MREPVSSLSLTGIANLAVMAPLLDGAVPGFESITYAERLDRLLKALNTARVALRESALLPPAFPDAIGRFESIHHFRYAIFDPAEHGAALPVAALTGAAQDRRRFLTLNVTFDGGFEPYMRVIYRDIGTFLDALFCHVDGYPGSRTSHYVDYCRWVRDHELGGGLNYIDSGATLGDARWHEAAGRAWLDAATPAQADLALAGLANPPLAQRRRQALATALADPAASQRALWHTLRSLKGLHRLLPYFPANERRDDLVLLRFASDLLSDGLAFIDALSGLLSQFGADEQARTKTVLKLFAEELAWVRTAAPQGATVPPPTFSPAVLQAGVLHGHGPVPCTHGRLLLLAVAHRDRALTFLAAGAATPDGAAPEEGVWRNVALTLTGLQALGVHPDWLRDLAPEFREGMEARCGLLGDLRGNHPDRWRRPLRTGAPAMAGDADRVELSSVHVAVVLRTVDDGTHAGHDGHPAFGAAAWVQRLRDPAQSGLVVLAEQAMRSWPAPSPHEAQPVPGTQRPRDHFGFLDGFSQPRPVAAPGTPARDEVPLGDLLLGHPNSRGDGPWPAAGGHPLLQDGCYLALRVLRQHVDRLQAVLRQADAVDGDAQANKAARELLAARLMGRHADGRPMVPLASGAHPVSNDFGYDADAQGRACPFASHVRRTNPRDGRPGMPRIVRRGMSYGPRVADDHSNAADERGLVFMALCASLAEQFETVQRWVAGGNASGVPSLWSDPFLGVPEAGRSRRLRWLEGPAAAPVARTVDLGEQALVELQWGLYLFVPSLPALAGLRRLAVAPPQKQKAPHKDAARLSTFERRAREWRAEFDHPRPQRRQAAWDEVRSAGGTKHITGSCLLGSHAAVSDALRDDGARFSTAGYGKRMTATIGRGYLGVDPASAQAPWAIDVNRLIGKLSDGAGCGAAMKTGTGVLGKTGELLAMQEPDGSSVVPIDLIAYSETVLGALCRFWFGLPDGAVMELAGRRDALHAKGDPVRCPGHLMAVSRHVFYPWPGDAVQEQATSQGVAFARQVKVWLGQAEVVHTPLVLKLLAVMKDKGVDRPDDDRVVATLSGLMLGFAPTVHGNFMRLMAHWQDDGTLWALQAALRQAVGAASATAAAAGANETAAAAAGVGAALAVLRPRLVEALREVSVPEVVWRQAGDEPPVINGKPLKAGDPVVLGLASAVRGCLHADPDDEQAQLDADALVFGGLWHKDGQPEAHACPGREMGLGVLAGMVAALLLQPGGLRRTGSPIQLLWLRR